MDELSHVMGKNHRIRRHDPFKTPEIATGIFSKDYPNHAHLIGEAILDHIMLDSRSKETPKKTIVKLFLSPTERERIWNNLEKELTRFKESEEKSLLIDSYTQGQLSFYEELKIYRELVKRFGFRLRYNDSGTFFIISKPSFGDTPFEEIVIALFFFPIYVPYKLIKKIYEEWKYREYRK